MANIQIYGTLPGGGGDIEIATEINAQSTNEKAAGAKAVYDVLPTNFTGTDGTANGTNGLVPAPTTSDVDKFLNSDGTWKEAGGGGLEEQGVFAITLNGLLAIDISSQKDITDITEKNKFLPVIQFMFDNLRVTPVILLKSTEIRTSHDPMPAIWLTTNENGIDASNNVLFYNMCLVHPRNDSFIGKINRVSLSISYSASNGVVTSINSVVINRGADIYLEQASNKVTSITSSSTDTQYPSAKAVYSLQPEYIILEGDISWLSGSTHQFENADDIALLNHFKDLALAEKHPRFGFTQTVQGTTSMVAKEPDNYMTYSGSNAFSALFSVYFGSGFGYYGISLDYNDDIWTLTAERLTSA